MSVTLILKFTRLQIPRRKIRWQLVYIPLIHTSVKNAQKISTFSKLSTHNIVSTETNIAKILLSCSTLWAVEGSHDILVKFTADIFFPTEDYVISLIISNTCFFRVLNYAILATTIVLGCEQAPSNGGKQFGEWESERESASEASG